MISKNFRQVEKVTSSGVCARPSDQLTTVVGFPTIPSEWLIGKNVETIPSNPINGYFFGTGHLSKALKQILCNMSNFA